MGHASLIGFNYLVSKAAKRMNFLEMDFTVCAYIFIFCDNLLVVSDEPVNSYIVITCNLKVAQHIV